MEASLSGKLSNLEKETEKKKKKRVGSEEQGMD